RARSRPPFFLTNSMSALARDQIATQVIPGALTIQERNRSQAIICACLDSATSIARWCDCFNNDSANFEKNMTFNGASPEWRLGAWAGSHRPQALTPTC